MFRVLVFAILLFISVPAAPSDDVNGDGFETILLPFAFFPVAFFQPAPEIPGAHGTIWTGEVWLQNRNDENLDLFAPCLRTTMCIDVSGIAGQTGRVYSDEARFPPELGFRFVIRADLARNVTFSNRIFERTMRSQPRGVDIPVVRERNFFSTPQTFLGVPAGSGVRTSLRIYDPWETSRPTDRPAPPLDAVVVEVRGAARELIGTATLRPAILNPTTAAEDWHKPGFAAIHDLAQTFPDLLHHDFVHIRVTPVPAGAQYWGMVAVTDNETQTVSIITAQ